MSMRPIPSAVSLAALVALPAAAILGMSGTVAAGGGGYTARVIASGASFHHTVGSGTEGLSDPDDIAYMGGEVFVAFQNGVGSQGQPSSTGNLDSTIVELSRSGALIDQWDVIGKVDGMSADPDHGRLIATVNEDGSSSIYTVKPSAGVITHFTYSEALPHDGGTDAISVYRDQVLVSASAPGTTGSPTNPPAIYRVVLDAGTGIATVVPLFGDGATARVANRGTGSYGSTVTLALTDPDSNEVVPWSAPRFEGDFELDSQGDQELIFSSDPGSASPSLWVLSLTQSIDDTGWATDRDATLYVTDSANNTIDTVRGPFTTGQPLVAVTPCDADSAPPSCTTPNWLGFLDLSTGNITPVPLSTGTLQPHGMTFGPGDDAS